MRFNKTHPILFRFLVWFFVPGFIAACFTYNTLLKSLPITEGVLQVTGLENPVKIVRDENSIPHIEAKTDQDAFFAIGYLHAQERMWQLEYQRRLGAGRLSEVFGTDTLKMDQFMRTLSQQRAAREAVKSLDEASLTALKSYVKGVNAWIDEGHILPLEFHILGFKPEPWQLEDSLLQLKLMAHNLDANYRQELTFELLVTQLGLEKATDIMPDYSNQVSKRSENDLKAPANNPLRTVLKNGGLIDKSVLRGLLAFGDYLEQDFQIGGEQLGSNGWAVSGDHTLSGKPLLANDPHLNTQIPSAWYLAELKGDQIHVSGATYPGVPFVVLGRNESIAWGGTALGGDVQDLFLERSNPQNEDEYDVDGRWVKMDVEVQWIKVKAEFPSFLTDPIPPLKWEVRRTRHGPLLSDVIDRAGYPLALRWTALNSVDKTFESFLKINYAGNLQTFQSALEDYVAPTLNFVYADVMGNIAYVSAGKIPVRRNGNGRIPVPGWHSDFEWSGYIPAENMPRSINPDSGYVVSANNKIHSPDYPYLISNNWAASYRADRIAEVIQGNIESGKKIDSSVFSTLQNDVKSLQAGELVKFVTGLRAQSIEQQSAIDLLQNWDGAMHIDSAAAALYQSWFRHFSRALLNDELRGDLLHPERLDQLATFAERLNPVFVNQIINSPESLNHQGWCDHIYTTSLESCEDIALTALDKATDELLSLTGKEPLWGDLHSAYYQHLGFNKIKVLDQIFNRVERSPGDGFSINVGSWKYSKDKGYEKKSGATYRQVIDLGRGDSSGYINDTGQSGNILSEFYDSNLPQYLQGKLLPMYFNSSISPAVSRVLQLEPTQTAAGGGMSYE